MSERIDFEQWYKTGDLPWDTGKHDIHLEAVLKEYSITPCSTLELGGGTGNDAIWLAKKGFKVTAVDISPTAVEMALKKASQAEVDVKFINVNILKDRVPNGPFDFVFDRGCFHVFDTQAERSKLSEIIWNHLNPGGHWFSLIGSTEGPEREKGPPRRSALDIASAVESRFEILFLKTTHFDSNLPEELRAWECLMKRRDTIY